MKRHAVDVARVAGQLADELAVGDVPEADAAVVAAAGEERAVGADVERADPAFVGVDRADGLRRCVGGGVPPGELAVAAAADDLRAVLGETRARWTQVSWPPVKTVRAPSARLKRSTTASSEPQKTKRPAGSNRHAFSGRSCGHCETTCASFGSRPSGAVM